MSIMCFVGLDMLMGLDTPKLIVPTEVKVFDFLPKPVCIHAITSSASLLHSPRIMFNHFLKHLLYLTLMIIL